MRPVSRWLGVVALCGTCAAGCSVWGEEGDADACVSAEEYQQALEAPDLSVPAGLDRPDTSLRLDVPDGPLPQRPLERDAACLQRPPSFFDKPLVPDGSN